MPILLLLLLINAVSAAPFVMGASGAPGLQSCASSCHGEGNGTVEVQGFPTIYVPDSLYLISLYSNGLPIKNFNASCRIGEGTLSAGMILGIADGHTATYSLPEENNGVHASLLDQDTLLFSWRAPALGTGEVRLYIAAHQGHGSGPNNDLLLVADEIFVEQPPDAPSHPVPMDNSENVSVQTSISWDEVANADSFRVYFGSTTPPPLVSLQTPIFFNLDTLNFSTIYFWQVVATNEAGETASPVWSFTTEAQSPSEDGPWVGNFMIYPPHPNPFNGATNIAFEVNGPTPVRIEIFDTQGRFVETLFNGTAAHGRNDFIWKPRGAAGLYFFRASIGASNVILKTLYLK